MDLRNQIVKFLMVFSMIMVSFLCFPEYLIRFAFFRFISYTFYLWCSVFDVDIGDGMPIRKLPYNRSGTHFYLQAACLILT